MVAARIASASGDKKLASAVDLLAAADELYEVRRRADGDTPPDKIRELRRAARQCSCSAPKRPASIADELARRVGEASTDSRHAETIALVQSLTPQMRHELRD
jgi:hypothetical protein